MDPEVVSYQLLQAVLQAYIYSCHMHVLWKLYLMEILSKDLTDGIEEVLARMDH